MMKLVFATGNKGKLREAAEILGSGFELLSSAQAGVTEDVEETGFTLKENSIIKAQHLRGLTGLDCFADDTGLEVDALGGAPGVFTARFAGPACNFDDNMEKLLRELAARPSLPRTARFRSVVTLLIGGEMHFFEGVLEGSIALAKAGCGGFGYDPVFIPAVTPELLRGLSHEAAAELSVPGRTLAEVSEQTKNAISHRGMALRAMGEWLRSRVREEH